MDPDELRRDMQLEKLKKTISAPEPSRWLPSTAMFSRKVNVVMHTCDKCVFQLQVGVTEQLLKGWFPKNLKFGPHVVKTACVAEKRDRWNRNCMQCTGALDCLACFADKTHDFDVFVDGVLLHSKRTHGHGFPGFASGGSIAEQIMEFRQASLRQAIADLLDGKEPAMENADEVEFKTLAEAEDKRYTEQMAARQAAKKVEKEAWQKSEAERLADIRSATQQGKTTKPKSKPKAEAVAVSRGQGQETKEATKEQLVQRRLRPDEDVVVRSLPWTLIFCCRQSEVLVREPGLREDEDAPVQVI